MKIGEVIYTALTTDAAIDAILKSNVRPVVLPQSAGFPAAVYTTTSIEPNHTKGRPSTNDKINIQLDLYAETYKEVEDLAVKVRAKFDLYSSDEISQAWFTGQQDGGYDENHLVFIINQTYTFRSK